MQSNLSETVPKRTFQRGKCPTINVEASAQYVRRGAFPKIVKIDEIVKNVEKYDREINFREHFYRKKNCPRTPGGVPLV